jgi:hypothetical protein
MAVVASWDGATRRIYLAQGVTTFHPIDDIYREYREARRTDETFRRWEPFMVAVGNEPKGGGRFTPRYLLLLDDGDIGQVKIVPFDESITIDVTGEVLTEDQTDPFDYSTQTTPTVVRYAPAEAEIIELGTSGLTPEESADLSAARVAAEAAQVDNRIALYGKKITRKATDPLTGPGTFEIYDPDTGLLVGTADAYEDEDGTIGYRGRGIDRQDVVS